MFRAIDDSKFEAEYVAHLLLLLSPQTTIATSAEAFRDSEPRPRGVASRSRCRSPQTGAAARSRSVRVLGVEWPSKQGILLPGIATDGIGKARSSKQGRRVSFPVSERRASMASAGQVFELGAFSEQCYVFRAMRPLILCRERLDRIARILKRRGGAVTIRDLWRSYGIRDWEVQQAVELGWLKITIRKPRVGRPSQLVEFCGLINAKFPSPRRSLEKEISGRHWLFALRSVTQAVKYGSSFCGFGIPGIVSAYANTYKPRSWNGAYASASRLLKRRDVRAARQWFYG